MSNWEGFEHGIGMGFSMIPVKPAAKDSYIRWKDFQHRKPLPREVALWKSSFPDANPCLVCGSISDILVLDLDGPEAHHIVRERFKGLPKTVVVITPGGKNRCHYWFKYPTGFGIVHNFTAGYNKDMPGVDMKADGGYVLYPGAVHKSGGTYQFMEGRSPVDIAIADVPDWVLEAIEKKNGEIEMEAQQFRVRMKQTVRERTGRLDTSFAQQREEKRHQAYAKQVIEGCLDDVSGASSGGRNNILFKAAARIASLATTGLIDIGIIESQLESAALRAGLEIGEIRRTMKSGFVRGQYQIFTFPEPDDKYHGTIIKNYEPSEDAYARLRKGGDSGR